MNPFNAIANSTYDWESWVSEEGKLLWTNPAVERITGYTPKECLEMANYPLCLVLEEDRPLVEEVLRDARKGGSKNHVEFRIRRKDANIIWGAISFQPLVEEDGTIHGYRSSVRDIDERKHMEQALWRAMHEADQANRAKSQFLANVSHELKTPLQAIMGLAELVEREGPKSKFGRYGATIFQQAQVLEQLVSQLLDYAALDSQEVPLQFERFSGKELVQKTLVGLLPMALGRGAALSWNLDDDCTLHNDAGRITQVLVNLVGNSLKFAVPGPVMVSTHVEREHWVLVVDDAGPGVKDEQLIFRPFVQEAQDQDGHKSDGVGLGLAICQQIATRLGGAIRYTTSPLGGARFEVSFARDLPSLNSLKASEPEPKRLQEGAGAEQEQAPAAQAQRLLVVDDTTASREAVCALLESLGSLATGAASAEEALQLVRINAFDAIVIDLQMPRVDGWAAASQIRESALNSPYLVAMSAASHEVNKERLNKAGFDTFVAKPVSRAQLAGLLESVRQYREAESELFNRSRWNELAAIDTIEGTLLRRMQRRVGEQLPRTETELREALERHDSKSAAAALHTLSGLFGLIGAESARRASITLEERFAENPSVSLEDYLPVLEYSSRVERALTRLVEAN